MLILKGMGGDGKAVAIILKSKKMCLSIGSQVFAMWC